MRPVRTTQLAHQINSKVRAGAKPIEFLISGLLFPNGFQVWMIKEEVTFPVGLYLECDAEAVIFWVIARAKYHIETIAQFVC